mmetsp:Transcript_13883/g.54838  ORF Transcript_13883/g.54838 Transcript_13883/m.54838 type:complete len:845 (-) Transcript_13883:73-2607(-)
MPRKPNKASAGKGLPQGTSGDGYEQAHAFIEVLDSYVHLLTGEAEDSSDTNFLVAGRTLSVQVHHPHGWQVGTISTSYRIMEKEDKPAVLEPATVFGDEYILKDSFVKPRPMPKTELVETATQAPLPDPVDKGQLILSNILEGNTALPSSALAEEGAGTSSEESSTLHTFQFRLQLPARELRAMTPTKGRRPLGAERFHVGRIAFGQFFVFLEARPDSGVPFSKSMVVLRSPVIQFFFRLDACQTPGIKGPARWKVQLPPAKSTDMTPPAKRPYAGADTEEEADEDEVEAVEEVTEEKPTAAAKDKEEKKKTADSESESSDSDAEAEERRKRRMEREVVAGARERRMPKWREAYVTNVPGRSTPTRGSDEKEGEEGKASRSRSTRLRGAGAGGSEAARGSGRPVRGSTERGEKKREQKGKSGEKETAKNGDANDDPTHRHSSRSGGKAGAEEPAKYKGKGRGQSKGSGRSKSKETRKKAEKEQSSPKATKEEAASEEASGEDGAAVSPEGLDANEVFKRKRKYVTMQPGIVAPTGEGPDLTALLCFMFSGTDKVVVCPYMGCPSVMVPRESLRQHLIAHEARGDLLLPHVLVRFQSTESSVPERLLRQPPTDAKRTMLPPAAQLRKMAWEDPIGSYLPEDLEDGILRIWHGHLLWHSISEERLAADVATVPVDDYGMQACPVPGCRITTGASRFPEHYLGHFLMQRIHRQRARPRSSDVSESPASAVSPRDSYESSERTPTFAYRGSNGRFSRAPGKPPRKRQATERSHKPRSSSKASPAPSPGQPIIAAMTPASATYGSANALRQGARYTAVAQEDDSDTDMEMEEAGDCFYIDGISFGAMSE